jgi:ATP-dependent Clp protease ATP-binding subunit ClpA
MYERFTDRARKVMQLANQEAQRFNHEYIGTEHILLGLVKEGSGVAANVLKNLDVDLRKIRLEVEKIVQSGPDMVTMGKLPQTPRAKKVIEYAIEEARNLNHNYVGTEHLLLGLLREQEGVAAQVLTNLGVKLEDVRAEIMQLLGHDVRPARRVQQGEKPPLREYDLYLPLRLPNGQMVTETQLAELQQRLRNQPGVLAVLQYPGTGVGREGETTFQVEVMLFRLLVKKRRDAEAFLVQLKEGLKREWQCEEIILLRRKVKIV